MALNVRIYENGELIQRRTYIKMVFIVKIQDFVKKSFFKKSFQIILAKL